MSVTLLVLDKYFSYQETCMSVDVLVARLDKYFNYQESVRP